MDRSDGVKEREGGREGRGRRRLGCGVGDDNIWVEILLKIVMITGNKLCIHFDMLIHVL